MNDHRSLFPDRMLRLAAQLEARAKVSWLAMGSSDEIELDSDSPFALGGHRSFVPELGRMTWDLSSAETKRTSLSARIFEIDDGRSVGYIRVPHYSIDDAAVEVFRSVIMHFNDATDALVLDQVNNPGGSLFHAYALLAYLTDRELDVPRHQISIDDDQIAEAEEAVWLSETDGGGDPTDWPTPEIVAYSQFVLSEVEAGRKRLTNPGHVFGVGAIQPSADPYTKPVVALINELTFSAPEFLAAIMQDSGRGRLFGQRTAGAGGLQKSISIPGMRQLGIEGMSITWTFATRADGRPIENIGVHPDIEYSITAEDLQGGFRGYRNALLKLVKAEIRSA